MAAEIGPFDGPREFPYIKPAGRRVTQYEAVSCNIQPNERGFERAGTFTGRADGRPTWDLDSTTARSTDWYAFRDPAQMWNRNYITRQNEQELSIERVVRYARENGLLASLDPEWVTEALGRVLVTCTFFEYSLFRAFAYCQREALSDTIAQALTFNATDKVRLYQDIIIYQLELVDGGAPIGTDPRKSVWMEDEAFQGLRRISERVLATNDWCELALMINLVIEPVLAKFIYQDVLYRAAGGRYDSITPVLLVEADRDRQRNRDYARALLTMLLNDPSDAEHNREVVQGWLDSWNDDVRAALAGLAPLGTGLGIDTDAACGRRLDEWQAEMKDFGLNSDVKVAR